MKLVVICFTSSFPELQKDIFIPAAPGSESLLSLQCERRSSTSAQNNRQNCSSVYINLYIFRD